MITSKQIIKLCEDWYKSTMVYGHQVDIYENPGSSDLVKLSKNINNPKKRVRFIANAESPQTVYVADALQILHTDMLTTLGIKNRHTTPPPNLAVGEGIIIGGKIVLIEELKVAENLYGGIERLSNLVSHLLLSGKDVDKEKNWLSEVFKYNWSFLDKYISGTEQVINHEKQIFLGWLKAHDNK
jgi:hypothetical protein